MNILSTIRTFHPLVVIKFKVKYAQIIIPEEIRESN